MAMIRARQQPLTRRFPHQANKKFIVPRRWKTIGEVIHADQGESYTVTLTGPSATASVRFSGLDPEKRYECFATLISKAYPAAGEDWDPTTFPCEGEDGWDRRTSRVGVTSWTYTGGSTVGWNACNSAEAPADYAATFGHFRVQEISQ